MREPIIEFMPMCVHTNHIPLTLLILWDGRALDGSSETPQWPVNQKTPYTSNQLTELELKLNELKELLYKNFPPQSAQIFALNSTLSNTAENNAYLESVLNSLRTKFGGV